MNLKENLETELSLIEQIIELMDKSRMGAGILFIPEGLTSSVDSETYGEDNFEEELVEALSQPITEPWSESNFMGLIIRGPEALLDKVEHLDFTGDKEFREDLCVRAYNLKARIKHLEDLESGG